MHNNNDECEKFWQLDPTITPLINVLQLPLSLSEGAIIFTISAGVCELDFIRAHLHRKGPILHQMYTLFDLNAWK